MLQFVRSTMVVVFLPVLAVTAVAFKCTLFAIRFLGRLVGCEIVWPPVPVAENEAEDETQVEILSTPSSSA